MLDNRGSMPGGISMAEGLLTNGTDTFSGARRRGGEQQPATDGRAWTRNIIKVRPGEKG